MASSLKDLAKGAKPQPQPSPKGDTLTPVAALMKLISFICAHNTETAISYAVDMAPFLPLTVKQRIQVHNSAVSLFAAGRKIELGSGANRREPTQEDVNSMNQDAAALTAAVVAASQAGKEPRFVWAHQRFNPLVSPGKPRYSALSVAYSEVVAAGKVTPPQEYVEAVKEAVARDILTQQVRAGGYVVAIKAEADEQSAANKAAKPEKKAKASSVAMLE